ncbi:MAG: BTAD domain-containing putative transcriptional regulator [Gemmatimonadales bacterium]
MLRLRVLGGAAIESSGVPLAAKTAQRHRLGLLAILAAADDTVYRDELITLLWPNADPDQAELYLSDAVFHLNQELGGEIIYATPAGLRLNTEAMASDLAQFEAALAARRDEEAIARYGGPFLEGFLLPESGPFDRWVEDQQQRLTRQVAGALERLADAAEEAGNSSAAVGWWRRLASLDRHDGRVARRLMQALDAAGERAAALHHAALFQRLRQEELGQPADPEVAALADALLRAPTEPHLPRIGNPASLVIERPAEKLLTFPPEPLVPIQSPFEAAARRRRRYAAAAAAVLLLAAGWWWFGPRGEVDADPDAAQAAVVVLPFADSSATAGGPPFGDGIAESVAGALRQIPGLRVVGWRSSHAWKGRTPDVRDVSRTYRARWIVDGSVDAGAGPPRVSARLMDAQTGERLWSAELAPPGDSAFSLGYRIARAVAPVLRDQPTADRIGPPPAVGLMDYGRYLRGRTALAVGSPDSLRSAIRHFLAVVEQSPGFAPAHAGLADAYAGLGLAGALAPNDAFAKAREAANQALALEPRLAAPHATLGLIALYHDWDFGTSELEFRRSLDFEPASARTLERLATLLTAAGRFSEAEDVIERARDIDPLSPTAAALPTWILFHAGRYDEAQAAGRRALGQFPESAALWLWFGQAAVAAGADSVARPALDTAVQRSNRGPVETAELAYARARRGELDAARALVGELERRARGPELPVYQIAKIHLALGDSRRGLEWLRRAMRDRSPALVFLQVDPELAASRYAPWWAGFLAETGIH